MWVLGLVLGKSGQYSHLLNPLQPPLSFFFFKSTESPRKRQAVPCGHVREQTGKEEVFVLSVSFPSEGSDYMSIAPF